MILNTELQIFKWSVDVIEPKYLREYFPEKFILKKSMEL